MTIKEKAAYLKGLASGLSLDMSTPEAKLIDALIDLVSDVCAEVAEVSDETHVLNDYIEEIDEDLGNVEEIVFGDDDDCDCDECDCDDCDCDCDECDCDDCDCDHDECDCNKCDCCESDKK